MAGDTKQEGHSTSKVLLLENLSLVATRLTSEGEATDSRTCVPDLNWWAGQYGRRPSFKGKSQHLELSLETNGQIKVLFSALLTVLIFSWFFHVTAMIPTPEQPI